MDLKIRHRIPQKQARSIILTALFLGVFSTGLQIYLDLQQVRQSTTEDLKRILAMHTETASHAVYNLNSMQAREVTAALISYPMIYQAKLVDDFAEVLAEHRRAPTFRDSFISRLTQNLFDINRRLESSLALESTQYYSARLVVDLDTVYIANNFTRRAINSLSLGLLHNLFLASLFLMLFYRFLSRPIVDIAQWVQQLRLGNKNATLPYQEDDELGDLVRSFSGLWNDRRFAAEKLEKMVAELSDSEHFARSIMDHAGDAMFLCKPDTGIFQVNQQGVATLGFSKSELCKMRLADFSEKYSFSDFLALFATTSVKEATTFEDVQRRSDGSTFPIEARAIKLTVQCQDYLLIIARDISVRKQAEKRIHELAFYDTLTGLPNRRLFLDRLTAVLELHRVNKHFGTVLFLDLDRFKTINDSLGHGIGDSLLVNIAQRLGNILPSEATCARFGGDEFVILLPEVAESPELCAEGSAHLAEEILTTMAEPFSLDGHLFYCTVSIGLSVFPKPDVSANDLIRQADTALYRVKAMGRNGFQFYDPQMQSSAQERLEVEKGLHEALKQDQFVLWFQPQYSADDEMIGAEALLRWQHPEKGMIFPGAFIQVAEESGQVVEIGNWVLRNGLQQLSQWQLQGLPTSFKRLAINISPMQFMQVDFVDQVIALMREFGIPGHRLELEITENMLLNNFEVACKKMQLLKDKGISFAIDDFGTGYSSLKYLQYLPLDILKIDRSFVTGLTPSSEQAALVQVIVATADRLKLDVIAEGVESDAEKGALMQLGCNCFQGYLLSKPLPVEQFKQQLFSAKVAVTC